MKNGAFISCVYLGFFSQVAQVIILRETLAAFAGVEMVLGLTLAVWLLAVGVGGYAGNRLPVRVSPRADRSTGEGTYQAVGILFAIAGVLLPLTVMAIRQLPAIFNFAPGEIMGVGVSLLGALLTISPLCLVLGLLFTVNARLFAHEAQTWVGQAYLLEAAGAAAGGLVVTFILLPFSSDLVVTLGLIPPTIGIIVVLRGRMSLFYAIRLFFLTAIWFIFAANFGPIARFDRATRAINRAVGEVVAVADSPHGQLAVTRYVDQYSLFVNGTLSSSYPDQLSAEEAVHFALLSHPAPQSALLIGGGTGGALGEMRKHGVSVDYVELDPRLIELARDNFPGTVTREFADCRIITGDGRAYLAQTGVRYDVIVLNLGEPSTAMVNRFFTREFYALVKDHLTPTGVFSFRAVSAEEYISPERGMFLSTLYKTLKEVFSKIVVLPGRTNIFIVGNDAVKLISRPEQFAARLQERGIHTSFVNESMLPFRLTPAASEYLGQQLNIPEAGLNTDRQPLCYYYNSILWSRQFTGRSATSPSFITSLSPPVLIAAALVFFVLVLLACWLTRSGSSVPFIFSLFISGMTAMAMEIVLLYCFQVYLGHIYAKIGVLVACFMVGMSLGSYLFNRRVQVSPSILILGHIVPAVLMAGFLGCTTLCSAGSLSGAVVELLFYLFSLLFGAAGGALFIVANRLYMLRLCSAGAVPVGTGYAVDLAGSALGALVVSSLLLPVWGIAQTIWLLAALNLIVIFIVSLFGRIQK
jgi:spermidine synthase